MDTRSGASVTRPGSKDGRGAVLWIAVAAILVGSGIFVWRFLAEPSESPRDAPTDVRSEPPAEPSRASGRRAILPLRTETLVPAAAGVDVRWARENREAIAALDAGDLEEAVAMFERCLAAVPGEPVFARNLAEALARLAVDEEERGSAAERELALVHLARALELAPDRADIAKRLEQMKKLVESEHGFAVEISEHFELSYDGARTDLLWSSFEIVKVLESAYGDFGELFGLWPVEGGRPRIRVVLYRKTGFHEATGMGHWAAGVFDGAVRVPLEDLGREKATLQRVLRHEVAHAFIRESGGTGVPGWLNEGLAQWLENWDLIDRAREIGIARGKIAGKTLIPLEKLQGSLSEIHGEEELSLAYAQALALCGFIDRNFGERVLFDMVAASKSATAAGWREVYRLRTGVEVEDTLAEIAR